jgi:hypothetical protein
MIDETLSADELSARAEEAYIYAFPMLMGYRYFFASFIAEVAPTFRVPINTLSSDAEALDHRFKDVISPNADTPYSFAGLDLRSEPMVLSVPEVEDRYYVFQFEDLLGFNAHYVGTRATGTAAGSYVLAGPGWHGEVPDGMDDVLRFETDIVLPIGRTQLLGPDDVDRLAAVQSGYLLRPLSEVAGTPAPPAAPDIGWPGWDDAASRDERFIGYLSFLLGFCQPIHSDDRELLERMRGIGVEPGVFVDADASPQETRDALAAGVASARAKMAEVVRTMPSYPAGWTNTDCFGTREFFDGDYLLRAAGAQMGWGGNDRIEAFYPMLDEDADGDKFDGSAYAYTLSWKTDPPCDAFWSVTMYDKAYDGTAGYLVENPIGRYLINSTTEGLVRGDDGSLTMYIRHERPESAAAAANWLPAPAEPFYLILRIYSPTEEALDGTWEPPAVVKA